MQHVVYSVYALMLLMQDWTRVLLIIGVNAVYTGRVKL